MTLLDGIEDEVSSDVPDVIHHRGSVVAKVLDDRTTREDDVVAGYVSVKQHTLTVIAELTAREQEGLPVDVISRRVVPRERSEIERELRDWHRIG